MLTTKTAEPLWHLVKQVAHPNEHPRRGLKPLRGHLQAIWVLVLEEYGLVMFDDEVP